MARIALPEGALSELGAGARPRAAKRMHRELMELVRRHGTLTFASDEAAARFVRMLRRSSSDLPHGTAQEWTTLLVELRKASRVKTGHPAREGLAEIGDLPGLASMWSGLAEVAVLDEPTAHKLGIPDDPGYAAHDGDFEASMIDVVADCQRFSTFSTLMAQRTLPPGAARGNFWDGVLAPLARNSKHATVVDTYLFRRLWETSGATKEQVLWLLEHLASEPSFGGYVTLIGEDLKGRGAEATAETLRRSLGHLRGGPLKEITVCLTAKGKRRITPHDRHIRFGTVAVTLSAGFDRLAAPSISDPDGMTWMYTWDTAPISLLRDAENRCLQYPSADIFRLPL